MSSGTKFKKTEISMNRHGGAIKNFGVEQLLCVLCTSAVNKIKHRKSTPRAQSYFM
jgi:peptide subunit release factor RF-3